VFERVKMFIARAPLDAGLNENDWSERCKITGGKVETFAVSKICKLLLDRMGGGKERENG
jgi:hypothetical protein